MKVGILTFQQSNNYGAILQTYALQKVIKRYNSETEVINYDCEYISKPYRLINLKKKGLFNYLFGIIGYLCYKPRSKKCNEFRKYITYSERVDRITIKNLSSSYDLFITGSDQVWNYKLTNSDYNYLLEFVKEANKKCSYAASFGIKSLDINEKEKYKQLLSNFNKITVRESQGKDILDELFENNAEVVIDPTLLLTKEEWMEVTRDYKNNKKYILVYQLGLSKKMINFVKKLSNHFKYEIIYVPFPLGKYIKSKWNITCGPSEWLGLFKNAQYIVTDSFHGTVFSILFNKNFFTEICDQNSGVGARIESLLERFNLTNRLLVEGENANIDDDIDYNEINKLLDKERKRSTKILKEMLNINLGEEKDGSVQG